MRIYPSVRAEIEEIFQSEAAFRPTIMLVKSRNTFQTIAGNDVVVALAIPEKNLIVIDNSKMKTHPFTLEITLKHELCHLFLYQYNQKGNLPRWLNEGICQWASGGIAEIIAGDNKDLLKQATLSGRFLGIRELSERFPEDRRSFVLAYEESKSIVEYIDSKFGKSGILRILNHLQDGEDEDTAVFKGLSITVDELEDRWHDHLRKKYTWFTYLSSHIYQILFSFAALVLVYGFIKLLMRKRAYRDEEEEDTVD